MRVSILTSLAAVLAPAVLGANLPPRAAAAKSRCPLEAVGGKSLPRLRPLVNPPEENDPIIAIKTYLHVVARSNTTAGGWLTDEDLETQIQVLNAAYTNTGFQFDWQRAETTRTINPEWTQFPADWGSQFPEVSPWEVEWKSQLRKGGDDLTVLNLYFNPGLPAYGVAVLIDLQGDLPDFTAFDGAIIEPSTIVGGPDPYINEGKTAAHEVGHWLGLYHTFQDGCDDGDFVADTPPADYPMTSFTFCSEPFDNTCPDTLGPGGSDAIDPNTNFMSYSTDFCMSEFTPGQITRMHQIWRQYRAV